MLLLVPIAGGVVFGIGPLVFPLQMAAATGYAGDDPYVGRLAGAATFGYAVALGWAVAKDGWTALRLLVVATLVFNLASLYACVAEILAGRAQPVVYLILATSILIVGITVFLLARHRVERGAPDIAPWVVWLIAVATFFAAVFGLAPLLVPEVSGRLSGFSVSDVFLFRQSGAATLGYAAMGLLELRSRRWAELLWPFVMGFAFNALSFVASLLAIAAGDTRLVISLVALASGAMTLLIGAAIMRRGA